MENDAWFFIGVFVFIFLVWIAAGGPTHAVSFTGVQLPTPGILGQQTTLQLPSSSSNATSTSTTTSGTSGVSVVCLPGSTICQNDSYSYGHTVYGESSGGSSGSEGTGYITPLPTPPEGVTYSPPSPYRNEVSMDDFVSNASSSNPDNEYVEIHIAENAGGPIDITKWAVESGATYNGGVIPRGTITPTSGVINPTQDIILYPGDSAYIISGVSPIGGSFRVNKCIGYLANFQPFTPSLPDNCPSASDELSSYYGTPYIHDPTCIDYASSLGRCQTAIIPQNTNLSLSCQEFLNTHLNYNGCLTAHQNDPDFAGTTWYIYLGLTTHLWRQTHEIVELLDPEGRTVDVFNY